MICVECVTPEQFKALISSVGKEAHCHYCKNIGKTIERASLFQHIEELFCENIATEDDLSSYEYGMLYEGGSDDITVEQDFEIVLSDWFELGEEPYFDDLCESFSIEFVTDEKGRASHFYSDDGQLEQNRYEDRWKKFVTDIEHAHRFFNPSAKSFLDSVFTHLCSADDILKAECMRTIEKGTSLFRARAASTHDEIKAIAENPASQLGPVPKRKARSQRMTPDGISALYCALDRETCLSEIRSITGDNVVSIAMTPINHLNLLDLTKLNALTGPSLTILDMGYRESLHRKGFVDSLVKKMSKPKGRNEELSYLSTQVVFEYLRLRFGGQVDGLVFPSVQTGEKGTNVVFFPERSVVSARNYRDTYDDEFAMPPKPEPEIQPFEPEATLYCLSGSLRFHKVQAIETKAVEHTHIFDLFMSDLTKKRLRLP
jgi:hypothetical protein